MELCEVQKLTLLAWSHYSAMDTLFVLQYYSIWSLCLSIDLLGLTETWLKPGDADAPKIEDLKPNGYKLPHEPRKKKRGGGVGILHRSNIDIATKVSVTFKSFEYMETVLKSPCKSVRVIVVYRPPPSKENRLTCKMFFEDFTVFLEQQTIANGCLLIMGDFNFHIEDASDREAMQFLELLDVNNLQQHISQITHKDGHTLDLVITRKDEDTVCNIHVSQPGISDHSAIHFQLTLDKPGYCRKEITYRKWKSLDISSFEADIQQSEIVQQPADSVTEIVEQYYSVLEGLLEKHIPLKKNTILIRPAAEWYTEEIAEAKSERRRLERYWRFSRLEIDRQLHAAQCRVVQNLLDKARCQYYNNIIKENSGDQKVLYKTVNKLLHRKAETPLPSHTSLEELAERFADFFSDKIMKIREKLLPQRGTFCETHMSGSIPLLTEFQEASEEEVKKLIKESAPKSCQLDPVPTWLLKECLSSLLPVITRIVNLSLSSSVVPEKLKEALLSPLIKKALMDSELLKNFRPVSNLAFISKIIEKVVASRTISHMCINKLYEPMQSAYRKYHSTETALLRVQNDILMSVDKKGAVVLLLLDLSAAFDTVDHAILLSRLSGWLGIQGKALTWFQSYLSSSACFIERSYIIRQAPALWSTSGLSTRPSAVYCLYLTLG